MIDNWGVTVYDEDDRVIAYWEILGRTEAEAEREASADVIQITDWDDWTLSKIGE